jgi:putative ABC transport system permease protein
MGGAISLVARSLLRRRWAGLVLIGLIAAITGAAVAGAATVARRTATAYPRLEAASGLGDAIAIVDGGPEVTEALLELPQVAAARPGTFLIGEDADEPYSYMGITVPVTDSPVVTPVITRGRAPDPSDPSHIVIPEWLADLAGIGPGTTFEFDLLSPVQYGEFPQQRPPDGPRISLEIVGVGRLAGLPEVLPPFHGTPALAAAHAEWQISDVLSVDLVDPAATGDFAAAVADLDRRSERIEGREEFTAVSASPVAQHRVSVGSSSRLLTGGLVAFVVAVVLAGTVALGQSLARLFGLDARDQQTEAALGLRPGARLAARLVIVAVPALLGAAGASPGASSVPGSSRSAPSVAWSPLPARPSTWRSSRRWSPARSWWSSPPVRWRWCAAAASRPRPPWADRAPWSGGWPRWGPGRSGSPASASRSSRAGDRGPCRPGPPSRASWAASSGSPPCWSR